MILKKYHKERVKKKAKGKCALCFSVTKLTIDHIKPKFAGGTNDLRNLQVLCLDCHKWKTNQDLKKYSHLLNK